MKKFFIELFHYRDLLLMFTIRDIKVRYKQAFMGFLWAIFMPVIAIFAGLLIKKIMAIMSGQTMDFRNIVTISVKVLPWTFFISALRFAVQSLVSSRDLITKIYFPREIIVLSPIFASFFDFFIASIFLTILLIFAQIGVSFYILFVPVLIFLLVIFTIGLGLILACANLFYRDVKYIVEVILMFGIFYTPVFYEADILGKWRPLLLANPVASILELLNQVVVLHKQPEIFWLSYSFITAVITFFIGLIIFQKKQKIFAESI